MNPKQVVPILTTFAPVIAAAPPVLIGLAIGAGLLWLLSGNKENPQPQTAPETPKQPQTVAAPIPVTIAAPVPKHAAQVAPEPQAVARRVKREDVAEALAYGARSMTRQEAVAALQNLGFGKTAAYKALSPNSRFVEFIEIAPDGLIEWKG